MKEVARELDGMRMMTKHPWVNIELNPEETECLLGEHSDTHNNGGSLNIVSTSDITTSQMVLPLNNGR